MRFLILKIGGSPQVPPEAKLLRLRQKIGSSMPKWIKPLLTCVYTVFNTHNPSHPNFQGLNTEDRLDARLITIGPRTSARRQARYGSTPGSIRLDASCGTARRQARYGSMPGSTSILDPRRNRSWSQARCSRRQSSMPPRRASIRPRFLDARAQPRGGWWRAGLRGGSFWH